MPVRSEALMDGTTLCPHCNTRFRIIEAQMAAHNGMVRCGHCMQIFDARPGFVSGEPHPQLELPISDSLAATELSPADETAEPDEERAGQEGVKSEPTVAADAAETGQTESQTGEVATEIPADTPVDLPEETQPDITVGEPGGETQVADVSPVMDVDASRPMTLAEQVAVVQDEDGSRYPHKRHNWPWAVAVALLLATLLAQGVYLFRVDLAIYRPELKPALIEYCRLLGCSMPLPRHLDSMSIESSSLEADGSHENQITLNALLRNRATYTQAYPHIELTFNDTQDKLLARRTFRPADYLPPPENEKDGLASSHEISIKLRLDTTDLRPVGYRLVLFYPQ